MFFRKNKFFFLSKALYTVKSLQALLKAPAAGAARERESGLDLAPTILAHTLQKGREPNCPLRNELCEVTSLK